MSEIQHLCSNLTTCLTKEGKDWNLSNAVKTTALGRDLQDGKRVRRGDHLPPHKYIRSTFTCGATHTEHLPNAGRRSQTSQKARNSPRSWVGK